MTDATTERRGPLRLRDLLLVLAGVVAGALLGWANLHSDDDGILAMLLLASSALLAAAQPRWAWAWALFLAACFPLSTLLAAGLHLPVPYPTPPALWQEVVLTLLLASLGAVSGWGIRRLARA
jgi:hypothetical protein